jgi:hypothetical protein
MRRRRRVFPSGSLPVGRDGSLLAQRPAGMPGPLAHIAWQESMRNGTAA